MKEPYKKPKGYPANTSGGLWTNKKTSHTQPDWKGAIEITKHQMEQLIHLGKTGQEPKLQLAAWARQDGSGLTYYSLSGDVYVKDAPQAAAPPAPVPPAPAPAAPAPAAPPMPSFDDFSDGTF